MAVRSVAGLPATASRSASYPGAIRPLRSPTAHAWAARLVAEGQGLGVGEPQAGAELDYPMRQAATVWSPMYESARDGS
jgi:hypothetical protein